MYRMDTAFCMLAALATKDPRILITYKYYTFITIIFASAPRIIAILDTFSDNTVTQL